MLLILTIITIMWYGNAINYYFVSDDWALLYRSNALGFPKAIIYSEAYHWLPLAGLIYSITYRLFGISPVVFHIYTLTFVILCAWMLFFLLYEISQSTILAALSSILFLVHPQLYVVPFFALLIIYAVGVTAFLLALIAFIRQQKYHNPLWFWVFIITMIISISAHEFGLLILPVCFAYWIIWRNPEKNEWFRISKFDLPSLRTLFVASLLGFIYLFIRRLLGVSMGFGVDLDLRLIFQNFRSLSLVSLIPSMSFFVNWIDTLSISLGNIPSARGLLETFFLLSSFLVILLFFFITKGIERRLIIFFISWITISILTIILILILSKQRLSIAPRYFIYIIPETSALIAIIIYKSFQFIKKSTFLRDNKLHIFISIIGFIAILLLLVGYFVDSYFYTKKRATDWKQASLIASQITNQLKNELSDAPPNSRILLVNVPSRILGGVFEGAFVLDFIPEYIKFIIQRNDLSAERICVQPFSCGLWLDTHPYYPIFSEAEFESMVTNLSEEYDFIFVYDPSTFQFEKLNN